MMPNSTNGRRALLLAGASVLMAVVPEIAWAQAASEPAPQEVPDNIAPTSEIVVTGSRVRGAAPVGSTVISLGRDSIESSPAVTTDRLIKELPQSFDLGVSENSGAQSGGSGNITDGNSVNLRGIG